MLYDIFKTVICIVHAKVINIAIMLVYYAVILNYYSVNTTFRSTLKTNYS